MTDALTVTQQLVAEGLLVTLDHLGEDTVETAQADTITAEYEELLDRLAATAPARAPRSRSSSPRSASSSTAGRRSRWRTPGAICAAARDAGTTVTLDMEDHTTVDSTLRDPARAARGLPRRPARSSRRTSAAPRSTAPTLADEGSRVRLCKGAYSAPESVAFTGKDEVDKSYVRCMKILMAGRGYPMLATHDPRLIEIAGSLAVLHGREHGDFEYQMLYGIRPNEQRRLAGLGAQMRVYVPYGEQWYGYLMRRLAERPANLGFFVQVAGDEVREPGTSFG